MQFGAQLTDESLQAQKDEKNDARSLQSRENLNEAMNRAMKYRKEGEKIEDIMLNALVMDKLTWSFQKSSAVEETAKKVLNPDKTEVKE